MLKKALFVGGALALLAALFLGRDVVSYATTTWSRVHDSVKNNVPVEFEIERARKMIQSLGPEIRENMHRIAREEVEVAKLERNLDQSQDQLARSRNEIMRLKGDLESGSSHFVYAGRTYDADQVRGDLANRFKHFKTSEATVENLQKILNARKNQLAAAREKMEKMLAAKRQLEVDVENLEARLKMVEVAQTTSEFNFDDSRLSRTKELISEIGTRLDVAEKLLNSDVQLYDRIPLEESNDATSEDVTDEITRYFGGETSVEVASYHQ